MSVGSHPSPDPSRGRFPWPDTLKGGPGRTRPGPARSDSRNVKDSRDFDDTFQVELFSLDPTKRKKERKTFNLLGFWTKSLELGSVYEKTTHWWGSSLVRPMKLKRSCDCDRPRSREVFRLPRPSVRWSLHTTLQRNKNWDLNARVRRKGRGTLR